MLSVQPCPVPPQALLARYAAPAAGGYADGYMMVVPGTVSLPAFVEAFYSSWAFRLELFVVGVVFGKAWSGAMAGRLARGETDGFSAWRVEDRTADELLMREIISDKTRSWLMVQAHTEAATPMTRVYFGSAILPVGVRADGSPRMSALFAPFLGFHRLYSRLLLAAARRRLAQAPTRHP
jgi:hypothetical protein